MFFWGKQRLENELAEWASRNFSDDMALAALAVARALQEQLGVGVPALKPNHDLREHLALDELEAEGIKLHFAEMGIRMEVQELMNLDTIDDLVRFIHQKMK